jgi:transcription initiation factor TFIIB
MEEEIIVFNNNSSAKPSCPECSSALIFDTSCGEYICQSCGYVVMDKMAYCGHESNSSNPDDRMKNMRGSGHSSFLLMNRGLNTEIGISDKDYTGKPISCATAERIASARRLHARIKASSEERSSFQDRCLKRPPRYTGAIRPETTQRGYQSLETL